MSDRFAAVTLYENNSRGIGGPCLVSRDVRHPLLPIGSYPTSEATYLSLEELTEKGIGSGWMIGRVAVRVAGDEVVEVLGTIGDNPPVNSPSAAARVALALDVPLAEPVRHFRMVGSGGIGHGGMDTRSVRFVASEWRTETVWTADLAFASEAA